MLRYFYIIILLISIKCIICYDYYDLKSSINRHIGRRDTDQLNDNANANKDRKFLADTPEAAQFDLSHFIQNTAEEAAKDNDFDVYGKGNEFNDYGSLEDPKVYESSIMQGKRQDYFNSGRDDVELVDTQDKMFEKSKPFDNNINVLNDKGNDKLQDHNDKHVSKHQEDVLLNRVDTPENKCSFRNMKFPFFSHNKSDKPKKQKRRKIFSIHDKKVESNGRKPTELSELQTKTSNGDKSNFCPVCKRKFKKKIYDELNREKLANDRNLYYNGQNYVDLNGKATEKRLERIRQNSKETGYN